MGWRGAGESEGEGGSYGVCVCVCVCNIVLYIPPYAARRAMAAVVYGAGVLKPGSRQKSSFAKHAHRLQKV